MNYKFSCPMPEMDFDTIQLAHGAGGKLSEELFKKIFLPAFNNELLAEENDQAIFNIKANSQIAFSTDSFVVDPIFFPNGNIGELAVYGTVNDIAMSGAKPLYLSLGFIIEEGLPIKDLYHITNSIQLAAQKANVKIITGDTKVVDKGSCDKIFINTSGIGILANHLNISGKNLKRGDKIIISGSIADHGMSILSARKKLSFESEINSDTAPLDKLVARMLKVCPEIHALRDPTRGGVATSLNEWARQSNIGIVINNLEIPIKDNVKEACEVLGIDPLYVANEGKLLACVPPQYADVTLATMHKDPLGKDACIIGEVSDKHPKIVIIKTLLGTYRILDMPIGEQLPRIC